MPLREANLACCLWILRWTSSECSEISEMAKALRVLLSATTTAVTSRDSLFCCRSFSASYPLLLRCLLWIVFSRSST